MVATYSIQITRGDDYTQSFDVWAKSKAYPTIDGDGVFVGNVPISTNATSVTTTWTPPAAGSWYFVIVSRRFDVYSRPIRTT